MAFQIAFPFGTSRRGKLTEVEADGWAVICESVAVVSSDTFPDTIAADTMARDLD